MIKTTKTVILPGKVTYSVLQCFIHPHTDTFQMSPLNSISAIVELAVIPGYLKGDQFYHL